MGLGDLRERGFRSGRAERRPESVPLSRVLGRGEDPLTWSVPVLVSSALRIRLHVLFLLVALWELFLSAPLGRIGTPHVAMALAALIVLVTVREAGRWLVAARRGEEPDQVILWPLGLLAATGMPRVRRPSPAFALAAPAVNLMLAPVLGGVLRGAGLGWESLIFNPLTPGIVVGGIGSYALAAVWWLYYVNLVLLAANLFVPMLPLDGGRLLEALLARRMDARSATLAACRVGLFTAMLLFVASMTSDQTRGMGVAVVGAGVCWIHLRRAEFVADPAASGVGSSARAPVVPEAQHFEAAVPAADPPPATAPEPDDSPEIDRILAKISASGLASLDAREKQTLEHATDRRRKSAVPTTNNR